MQNHATWRSNTFLLQSHQQSSCLIHAWSRFNLSFLRENTATSPNLAHFYMTWKGAYWGTYCRSCFTHTGRLSELQFHLRNFFDTAVQMAELAVVVVECRFPEPDFFYLAWWIAYSASLFSSHKPTLASMVQNIELYFAFLIAAAFIMRATFSTFDVLTSYEVCVRYARGDIYIFDTAEEVLRSVGVVFCGKWIFPEGQLAIVNPCNINFQDRFYRLMLEVVLLKLFRFILVICSN